VKQLIWLAITTIVFVGAMTTPVRLQADGTPPPYCPVGKVCKP